MCKKNWRVETGNEAHLHVQCRSLQTQVHNPQYPKSIQQSQQKKEKEWNFLKWHLFSVCSIYRPELAGINLNDCTAILLVQQCSCEFSNIIILVHVQNVYVELTF